MDLHHDNRWQTDITTHFEEEDEEEEQQHQHQHQKDLNDDRKIHDNRWQTDITTHFEEEEEEEQQHQHQQDLKDNRRIEESDVVFEAKKEETKREEDDNDDDDDDDARSIPPHGDSSHPTNENEDDYDKCNDIDDDTADDTHPAKQSKWGGIFLSTLHQSKTTPSSSPPYSELISIEGLNHILDPTNSHIRILAWLTAFILFGVFFVQTTIPLLQNYFQKTVTTSIDTHTGARTGLPLPIVTVCPAGSGIRCDCLLWRKLHCRYRVGGDARNEEWRMRFDRYACWSYFDRLGGGLEEEDGSPVWMSVHCEEFEDEEDTNATLSDPCGQVTTTNEEIPDASLSFDTIYTNILKRESSRQGPYITIEELLSYGSFRMNDNVHFFDSSIQTPLPSEWIHHAVFDISRIQLCSQLRPPPHNPQAMQRTPGASNGLSVLITNLSSQHFGLQDIDESTSSIDVHLHLPQEEDTIERQRALVVPRHEYLSIEAGFVTTIEYESTKFERYRGWGSISSQTCDPNTIEPRDACLMRRLYRQSADTCGCNPPTTTTSRFQHDRLMGCSHTIGTDERTCLDEKLSEWMKNSTIVGWDVCPVQCRQTKAKIMKNSVTLLSEGQMAYLRRFR